MVLSQVLHLRHFIFRLPSRNRVPLSHPIHALSHPIHVNTIYALTAMHMQKDT